MEIRSCWVKRKIWEIGFFFNKLRFYNSHCVSQKIVINWLNSIYNQLFNFISLLNRKLKVKSCIHKQKKKNNWGYKCKNLALLLIG